MTLEIFEIIVFSWIVMALVIFPVTLSITAPYGRHSKTTWGPMISNKLGWFLMELPSLAVFAYFFLSGPQQKDTVTWVLFGLYSLHYVNRVFIYPLRTKTKNKKMPVVIMLFAVFFNLMNGFIIGYWLGYVSFGFGPDYLTNPRFIIGIILFGVGFIINQDSDRRLLKLRKSGSNGYSIPYGGFFRWVSCPNFMGEIIEWAGFAMICWSWPAFSFALWTAVNLIPRALDHHRWYLGHFKDYPKERKAVFPFFL
jgi:hypothetical protein